MAGRHLTHPPSCPAPLLCPPNPSSPAPWQPTPPRSYVDKAHAKAGTELHLVVRGKPQKATVTKMPFVTTTYYKG